MLIESKRNLKSHPKEFSYVNISGLYINELCFDVYENTTEETDSEIITKLINEIIDHFEKRTEFFIYAKFEEIFAWPNFFKLMKLIYSIFEKRGLEHRLKFLDNNTSFKFKENKWNYEGIPLMLGHVVKNFKNGKEEIMTLDNVDEYVSEKKFDRTFLSLNGRPKEHREELVRFILENNIDDKFYYSFGTSYGNNKNHPLYKNLNDDFEDNKRGIGLRLSGYEKKSFCYVLTENSVAYQDTTDDLYLDSLIEYKPNLNTHITEKTTRGIGTMMPFVLIGQPYTLKILKENGFKTFDEWWDESYDLEEDFYFKFEKIKKIILDISTWDVEKQKSIYKEMLPTLYHNFKRHDELRKTMYDKYNLPDMIEFNSDKDDFYYSVFNKKIL